jgi:hypothetical protein
MGSVAWNLPRVISLFYLKRPVLPDPQWRGLPPIHDCIKQKPIGAVHQPNSRKISATLVTISL